MSSHDKSSLPPATLHSVCASPRTALKNTGFSEVPSQVLHSRRRAMFPLASPPDDGKPSLGGTVTRQGRSNHENRRWKGDSTVCSSAIYQV